LEKQLSETKRLLIKSISHFLIFILLFSCKVYTSAGNQLFRINDKEVTLKEEIAGGNNVTLLTIYNTRLAFKVEEVTDSTILGSRGEIIKFSEIKRITKSVYPVQGYLEPVLVVLLLALVAAYIIATLMGTSCC